jgi:hypothetical protein
MQDAKKLYGLIIVGLLVILLWTPVVLGVGPYEVIVRDEGKSLSWSLEPTMRHKLIPVLPNDWNDVISSIEVGSEVKVAVYQHANFCGPNRVFVGSVNYLGWWNDEISSLIVFPKTQANPLGVVLRSEQFNTVYGSAGEGVRTQFFPLPMYLEDAVAQYPVFGDYMNDEAHAVAIQGNYITAELFEHANFQGHRLRLPSTGLDCFPNTIYRWKGYQAFSLKWCKMGYGGEDFNEEVSSLIVSCPPPRVPRPGPPPSRYRAPPAP